MMMATTNHEATEMMNDTKNEIKQSASEEPLKTLKFSAKGLELSGLTSWHLTFAIALMAIVVLGVAWMFSS